MLDEECPKCRYRVGHSPDCGRDESLPCATCHDDPGTRWCGRCGRGCDPVPAYIQRELNALRTQLAERTRERDEAGRELAHTRGLLASAESVASGWRTECHNADERALKMRQARDAALAHVATLRGALRYLRRCDDCHAEIATTAFGCNVYCDGHAHAQCRDLPYAEEVRALAAADAAAQTAG